MKKKITIYAFLVILNVSMLALIYSLFRLNNYLETKLEEIHNLRLNYSRRIEDYKRAINFAKSLGINIINKEKAIRIVLNEVKNLENLGKTRILGELNVNEGKVSIKVELNFTPKSKEDLKNIVKKILDSKEPIVLLENFSIDNRQNVTKIILRMLIIQPYSG